MKLVMTLLVRNEADVIEANLAYHLDQGVDFVVATDNGSTDGTSDVLERFARAGHLHLIHEQGDYRQAEWVTRMARLAATEFGADWVINNDADEFWWPRSPSLSLKQVFSAIPPEVGSVVAPRSGFVSRPDESGFFADRLLVRNFRSPRHPLGLQGHPKVAHRARADVTVDRSNHRVHGEGLRSVPGWHPVVIFHYQARDEAGFVSKKLHHGEVLERTGFASSSTARRWQEHRAGVKTLEEGYRRHRLTDDAAVEEGLRDGRFVIDRRLGHFFERRSGDTPEPASDAGPDAAHARTRPSEEALTDEAVELADMLDDLMLGIDERSSSEREREKLERRVEQAERKRAKLAARLAAVEGSRWWRARPRAPQRTR